jgi:hypothetical protein
MGKKKTSATRDLQALRIGSQVRYAGEGEQVGGRIVWANATHVKIKWEDGEQVTWKRADLAKKSITILDPAADEAQPVPPPAPAVSGPTDQGGVQQAEPTETHPAPPTTEPAAEPAAPAGTGAPAPTAAKPKRQRKAPAAPKEKKVSCLDAAAHILAESGQPMTCQEMIDTMAAKGYWTSPGGKTPAATLYSAILRELATKGADARFAKTERGKFARKQ